MIRNDYYNWLISLVYDDRFCKGRSYDRLFGYLFNTDFTWLIDMDDNRASDGLYLRYRFSCNSEYSIDDVDFTFADKPCSVLEMLIGLARRCESEIMYDDFEGNRIGQWFWEMIVNLKLHKMSDDRFDERYCDRVMRIFLNREYDFDGKGGLFYVPNSDIDMRNTEIWMQLNYYISNI